MILEEAVQFLFDSVFVAHLNTQAACFREAAENLGPGVAVRELVFDDYRTTKPLGHHEKQHLQSNGCDHDRRFGHVGRDGVGGEFQFSAPLVRDVDGADAGLHVRKRGWD